MTPYLALASLAFRRRISSFSELFGRSALMVIILTAWSKIWGATAFGGFHGFVPTDGVWYLMTTEWIVLSTPYVYLEIEAEIRSGDFAYNQQRPGSYIGYQIAQGIGLGMASWIVMGAVGISTAYILTGVGPRISMTMFAAVALLALASISVTILVMTTLGLFAVWTNDAAPCAWVWQKLHFVLGGLMLPLSIYPQWLERLAQWTPFPALLGNLTDPLVTGSSLAIGKSLGALLVWGAGFASCLALVFSRALRRIQEG